MKSYTDLPQSKKLAEILPIESADMHYLSGVARLGKPYSETHIPCWSLAALLDVLLTDYSLGNKKGKYYVCMTHRKHDIVEYDNPVDACYEMLKKLKENEIYESK